jgi:predicted O-methyltransferase YrrM
MFGAGLGDAWLAKRCKHLFVVERNYEWLKTASQICADNKVGNVTYFLRKCNDSDGAADFYLELPPQKIDIIINDDAYRTELCQVAVDYFTQNGGGILICDNWYQSYVWLSDKAVEIMTPYINPELIFEQPDHKDNDGVNKWKTAAFIIK